MIDDAVLDDADALAGLDPQGVLLALAGAGAQVRHASVMTAETKVAGWGGMERPRAVVVAARGGAGVVAEAMATLIGRTGPVPVVMVSGSVLPQWVGPMDLVIALTLSGSADASVALAHEAGRRGCLLLTVGAEDSPLEQAAVQARGVHVPVMREHASGITIPTSRTALWALLTPAFVACRELDIVRDADVDLMEVADVLDAEAEACRPSSEAFVNPAKTLALELDGAIPVVLGADEVCAVAAHRAAAVLARTARVPAAHGGLPDDAGDIVATFGGPFAQTSTDDLFADPLMGEAKTGAALRLVVLGPEENRTVVAVSKMAEKAGVRMSHVPTDAPSELGKLAQLISRTDFAATYLALGSGVDPFINPHVADLREALG